MMVDEKINSILERAFNVTLTDYEIRWFDRSNKEGYIRAEDLISIIEDLICEVGYLKEEIEDIKQDIQDNYKPIPVAEQIGVGEKDFI